MNIRFNALPKRFVAATKWSVFLAIFFLPFAAFAQSIVWQTEIAGQTRSVQSRDDRVRLLVPTATVSRWRAGQTISIGKVNKVDSSGVEILLTAGKSFRDAIQRTRQLGVTEVAPVFVD